MSPDAEIATIAAAFTAGQFDWVITGYSYPLPIYLDGGLMVATNSSDAVNFFQSLLTLLQSDGLGFVEAHLDPVAAPQNGRFEMQTRWVWNGQLGRVPVMQTNCFNRGTWASHVTEMVQITLHHSKLAARLKTAA